MISTAMYIGSIIITAIITSLVVIFLTPIKNWVNNTRKEVCAYEKDQRSNPYLKEIVITEKFGKTSHINCYWFSRREEKEIDGIKYLHCFYGTKTKLPSGRNVVECPFIK
ncbi:MAG: hypothetical protein WCS69_09475 [Ignavibacteriaceae bacterium]|jgi:hypothetical protein